MESKFIVYDILEEESKVVNYKQLVSLLSGINLDVFNESRVSIVNVYVRGERTMIVSRVKEVHHE